MKMFKSTVTMKILKRHANFGNIRADDYVYIDVFDETEANLNNMNHFLEDHPANTVTRSGARI
jgi:hypothetical protein